MKAKLTAIIAVLGMTLLVLLTGCTAINSPPVASFARTPSSGEAPLNVSFNASASSDPDGSIVSYAWNFGDGGSGAGVAVTHTYTSTGTYTARLTVTDNDGDDDSATQTIQVSAAPVANTPPTASFIATPSSGEAPLAVNFNASASLDPDGSIVSYAWTFGDGGSASGVTVTHTYTDAGTYTARLTVTDNDVATGSTSQTIETFTPPHTANCQIGTSYLASDGLTVTLHSCVVVEKAGSYEYSIDYTLTNNTPDQAIDEGSFKMYYANEAGGLPQYGFFGKLFPGDTIDRTYAFEELKSKPFDLLEYHHDNFFSSSPLQNSLRWPVEVP